MKTRALIVITTILLNISSFAQSPEAPYFRSNGNQTPTYSEIKQFYTQLQKYNTSVTIKAQYYKTDVNDSLLLICLTKGEPANKVNVLINNGIHPGEPEGIDASMILVKNLLEVSNKRKSVKSSYFTQAYKNEEILRDILDVMNIYIIAVYNVDGHIRRNSTSRANQNGPEEYGFRGNALNLDLNRDFIKMDSKNAHSFASIFHSVNPHVFIDTHTSNGADYQHIVTYIATQKDKLQASISEYQYNSFIPSLNKKLQSYKFDPVPYVNAWSNIPDSGWSAFYESPRFATGYSTLFNTIGFTLETHMLKNYKQRVEGSYAFLLSCLEISKNDAAKIIAVKIKAEEEVRKQTIFPLNWKLDSTKVEYIDFKGYEASYKKSEVSDMDRLFYDRNKPFHKKVKFYSSYKATAVVKKPKAYIIPFAWRDVIDRLEKNKVILQQVLSDSTFIVNAYYIDDYKTVSKPYEGHYLHSNVKVHTEEQSITVRKGDYIVYTDQKNCRFIIETLEPQAIDSYFNWNFFDAILSQKEYFSDYVFEDTAAELLKKDPILKERLEKRKKEDASFAKNSDAQLDFVYRNSSYFEKSYLRYPIYRLEK